MLYCGEYYDAESGFIYLRNRYYDPSIGRFITEDPYWNVDNMIYGDDNGKVPSISAIMQSCNLYVYCGNNPINRYDPSGNNWLYDIWNWGEDSIWKCISIGVSAYGWQLSADLIWQAASGSGNKYIASEGSYASNLAKNDKGLNKFVNDVIWTYGTSRNISNPSIPTQTYEIPLSNGDLGVALHNVYVDINAGRNRNGSWTATVTITDTFDFTELKNPLKQGSVGKGLLWAANDIAYFDSEWGLLDPVAVTITYRRNY